MKTRLDRWIDRHIDRALRQDDDDVDVEQRRSIELFFVIASAAIAVSSVCAIGFFVMGAALRGAVTAVMTVLLVGARVAVQRRWLTVHGAATFYCVVPLVVIAMNSQHLGGVDAPSMVWLPLFVIFSSQIMGRRCGIIFAVFALAMLVTVSQLPSTTTLTPEEMHRYRLMTFAFALGFAAVLGVGIDRVRRRALERLVVVHEELLGAKRAAEAANRAKSDFLATVTHELRTPLHAITSITELLSQDRSLGAPHTERAATARDAARSLLGLVDDLLDRAAVEAGRVTLRPAPAILTGIVHEVRELVALRAAEKGIRIVVDEREPVPPVLVDAGRVRQILLNIVGNAIKFTDSGVIEIVLSARPASPGQLHVTLAVTDTGPGIAPERLDGIFERFERVDDAARRVEGSGLGLAIARDLLRLMDGDLVVRSTLGIGSTFYATLIAPRVHQNDSLRGRRVLLADDEIVSQRVTSWLLESLGCSVASVGGGLDALRLAERERFDVIMLDCNMPEMNGFETARRIRASGCNDVPILAFTAGQENRASALEAGMSDFLAKPIDRETLRAALLKHVRRADA